MQVDIHFATSFEDLQDLRTFASFRTQNFVKNVGNVSLSFRMRVLVSMELLKDQDHGERPQTERSC